MTHATAVQEPWQIWEDDTAYGDIFYQRALGTLPEMESARAITQLLKGQVRSHDRLLDVGCGAGHYLRSLRQSLSVPFVYTGVDATLPYIRLARKAWQEDPAASFAVADAYALPFADQTFDLVMSCNLLLHLPSIVRPLQELVRVSRRYVVIRTLVGERSFRIQEVRGAEPVAPPEEQDEFDAAGEPRRYNYYNIYGRAYVEKVLARLPRLAGYRIVEDTWADAARLATDPALQGRANGTHYLAGWQVNGYILQPWHFVCIEVARA